MLGEIFYWIFNMSIAATICGIPVLLIRLIKKLPRRVSVWLYLIPFIRMSFPVGISSKYGVMALISKFTAKTVTVYETEGYSVFTMMNHVMGAKSYFPITYKLKLLEKIFDTAALIWITEFFMALLIIIISYFSAMKEIKEAQLFKDNIYLSERITVPAVYGIIYPKIIFTYKYEQDCFEYILMHERSHIRRRDNLVRIAALFISCIHWFNPFSWLFLKSFYTDIELACDEAVLKKCGEAQKKEYARALLSSIEKQAFFSATFGGAKIKPRIENILSYRKLSAASAVAFFAVLLALTYAFLTNAS